MAAVIPAVTKISPRIIRILGCNPGSKTLQGTNTYIVGSGKRRVLIDTGAADVPQYINHLKSILKHDEIDLAHIFITHRHQDHMGGLADILEEFEENTKYCQVWKYPSPKDEITENVIEIEPLKDGQEFVVEGATLRVVHTPGPTDDHVVFHLLEDNVVFSGGCIVDEGTALFEDLSDYINSLKEIAKLQPEAIFPGHGNVIKKPVEKIQYCITHRMEQEEQILKVLTRNRTDSFGEEDLVKLIYTNLPEKLVKEAQFKVNYHLVKLLKEDRVQKDTEERWQVKEFDYIKSL